MTIGITEADRSRLLEILALWDVGRKQEALEQVAKHRTAALQAREDVGESVEPVAWVCDGLSDEMINAGCEAWDIAREEMEARERSDNPESFTDWDEGMIVAAIFKAMSAVRPTPVNRDE